MNPSRKKLLCWACEFGNSEQGRVGRSVSLRTSGIGALAFDNERSLMLKMPPSLLYESCVLFGVSGDSNVSTDTFDYDVG